MTVAAVLLGAAAVLPVCPAADDKPADTPLTIVDGGGKELKIKGWKIVGGTRKLGWLADGDKPTAPEAFIFRDDNSTNYKNGILTLIPIGSLHRRVRRRRADGDGQGARRRR